jgi:hypothetical protein
VNRFRFRRFRFRWLQIKLADSGVLPFRSHGVRLLGGREYCPVPGSTGPTLP